MSDIGPGDPLWSSFDRVAESYMKHEKYNRHDAQASARRWVNRMARKRAEMDEQKIERREVRRELV